MKKSFLSAAAVFLLSQNISACAWYDPDYDYFNLFTQTIIKDKSYVPFLLTVSNRFYGHDHFEIPDENIAAWQKFFNNALTYSETQTLVQKMPLGDLRAFKNGTAVNPLLRKLGTYSANAEAIDYLTEAKYLEPYMRINYVESPDSFYYTSEENQKNATDLDYGKTAAALKSLYAAAKNPEIKLRYGYQLVRFQHYTRHYDDAVTAFDIYVAPLRRQTVPYFMALDQLAGAQRGLGKNTDANWNFFKVFSNSTARKEAAFVSMKLSDSASFDNLLKRAQTPQEKNMAYFLLAYDEFSNPLPLMEKMYDIDPTSELLKVLAARSINELERTYLPLYAMQTPEATVKNDTSSGGIKNDKTAMATAKVSLWQKILNFFGSFFSTRKSADQGGSLSEIAKNPNRLPLKLDSQVNGQNSNADFLHDFQKLTNKIKAKSADEFWSIAAAYLQFLDKDYAKSTELLNEIKTAEPEYIAEIQRLKMLNDITSQPVIDATTEKRLTDTYPEFFREVFKKEKSATPEMEDPSTADFIRDILANRYFLQGEKGKSFLMSNRLSDLQYMPNKDLALQVQQFTSKKSKTPLEEMLLLHATDDVGNVEAFFAVIYGDHEMRKANFRKAVEFYAKGKNFSGIPRTDYSWMEDGSSTETPKKYGGSYNGYSPVSPLVFGHNVWESFQSEPRQSMKGADLSAFPFIPAKLTKLDLANALAELEKIGNGTDVRAAAANELIGNALYNTSVLGYFRELFVMDIDNSNGPKYHFYNSEKPVYSYDYKSFEDRSFIEPDNFDLPLKYYAKALQQTQDAEKKARLLFQMASAEQGKFYQAEARENFSADYSDPKYDEKAAAFDKKMVALKNEKYRTYFKELKNNYAETQTSKSLRSSCSYYDYFLRTR